MAKSRVYPYTNVSQLICGYCPKCNGAPKRGTVWGSAHKEMREEQHFQLYVQNAHLIPGLWAPYASTSQGHGGLALAYTPLCQMRGEAYPVMILGVLGAWAALIDKYHPKPSLTPSKMLSSYLWDCFVISQAIGPSALGTNDLYDPRFLLYSCTHGLCPLNNKRRADVITHICSSST